jgi:hypothetical protein
MTANAGDEFRATATPGPELLRRLLYLAQIGSQAVLPRGFTVRTAFMGADAGASNPIAQAMLRAARLADPAYQEMSARITGKLTRMDEASVIALQEIEQELQDLAREREQMRERAFRDERGRLMFMTEDESAAYFEDGSRVGDDDFATYRERLRGRTTWEQREADRRRVEALDEERRRIHRHDANRQQLQDDLASGSISYEEAAQREREIEEALPERVRRRYAPAEAAPALEADAGTGHAGPILTPPSR